LRRGGTLGNVACNLSPNGATKLLNKLQEKLPCVTAPLSYKSDLYLAEFIAVFEPEIFQHNLPAWRWNCGDVLRNY